MTGLVEQQLAARQLGPDVALATRTMLRGRSPGALLRTARHVYAAGMAREMAR